MKGEIEEEQDARFGIRAKIGSMLSLSPTARAKTPKPSNAAQDAKSRFEERGKIEGESPDGIRIRCHRSVLIILPPFCSQLDID